MRETASIMPRFCASRKTSFDQPKERHRYAPGCFEGRKMFFLAV